MFGYASISLTEIETIYAFMAAHTKVVSDVVLFFTGDIIEQETDSGRASSGEITFS